VGVANEEPVSWKNPANQETFMVGPVTRKRPGRSLPCLLSYASHDATVAQKVCLALEAAGFPCWIAGQNGVPGKLYAVGVVRAKDVVGPAAEDGRVVTHAQAKQRMSRWLK
jgi:hypothetical protein